MTNGKLIKPLKLFLMIIFLHLLVPAVYAQQQCCSFSNAEACITGGHPYDAKACTCNNNACEYMLLVKCAAAGLSINSSCQCVCTQSAVQYCASINRNIDPSTCQCAGCIPSAAASCYASGGIFNPDTCTCTMINPCATQYITVQNALVHCYGSGQCMSCDSGYLCWECFIYGSMIGLGGVYCGPYNDYEYLGCFIDYHPECSAMPGCCI